MTKEDSSQSGQLCTSCRKHFKTTINDRINGSLKARSLIPDQNTSKLSTSQPQAPQQETPVDPETDTPFITPERESSSTDNLLKFTPPGTPPSAAPPLVSESDITGLCAPQPPSGYDYRPVPAREEIPIRPAKQATKRTSRYADIFQQQQNEDPPSQVPFQTWQHGIRRRVAGLSDLGHAFVTGPCWQECDFCLYHEMEVSRIKALDAKRDAKDREGVARE